MAIMTYEEYLDEVTTLMTEKFDMTDEAAIKHVMRAQANDFFSKHDDIPEMRTQERAEQDAQAIFDLKNKSRPHVAPKRTTVKPTDEALLAAKLAAKSATKPETKAETKRVKPAFKKAVPAEVNPVSPVSPVNPVSPASSAPPDSPYGKRISKK